MSKVKKRGKYKVWTRKEEKILLKDCERKSVGEIAKKLKRSESSVQRKRKRMGLYGFMESTDMLNTVQISEITGSCQSSIRGTWQNKGLQLQKVGQYRVTTEENLINFMQEHPELWTASRCDYYYFSKYKWFCERLERERAGLEISEHERKLKKWTARDISRVKMLKNRGFTNKDIAKELGRTKCSIDHISQKIWRGEL